MRRTERMPRVNELLKREIADIIEKEYTSSFNNSLITVSEVNAATDLRDAKVYISIYGKDSNKEKILQTLKEKRGEIQRRISKDIILKYTPVLHFILDERFEKGDRILRIISELEGENKQCVHN